MPRFSRQAPRDRAFKRWRSTPVGSPVKVEEAVKKALGPDGSVTFLDVLRARYWQTYHTPVTAGWRKLGDKYYGPLLTAFEAQHGADVQMSIFGRSGLGVYKEKGLQFVIIANALRFDWSEGQALANRVDEVAERAEEWWGTIAERGWTRRKRDAAKAERERILDLCMGLMSSVFAAIDRENPLDGRCAGVERSSTYRRAMSSLDERISDVEANLEDSLQRSAQMFYGRGMFGGALGVAIFTVLVGLAFLHYHVRALYGVAFPAGAAGALVSVLQRMGTKNASTRLSLDPNAGQRLLPYYGAIRAVVGGVFGYMIFVFLKGGLFPELSVTPKAPLATFAAFGFLGGFNERWAQDMIAGSARRMEHEA